MTSDLGLLDYTVYTVWKGSIHKVMGIYELTAYDNGDLFTQQPDKGDDSRFYAKIWLYPSHYLVCKIFSSYLTEFVLYAMDSQS